MQKTLIFVHGGESFEWYDEYLNWIETTAISWNMKPFLIYDDWKKWKIELAKKFTDLWNLVYMPSLPNPQNAKYAEWKLFFDSWILKIEILGELIFIGSSLGGCFLLKYFSEKCYVCSWIFTTVFSQFDNRLRYG